MLYMRENIGMVRRMELDYSLGLMVLVIMVILWTTKFMGMENMFGLIIGNTRGNGRIIRWMVRENFCGLMGRNMLGTIRRIRNAG